MSEDDRDHPDTYTVELRDVPTISSENADRLARAGFRTVPAVRSASEVTLGEIEGLNQAIAGYIKSGINEEYPGHAEFPAHGGSTDHQSGPAGPPQDGRMGGDMSRGLIEGKSAASTWAAVWGGGTIHGDSLVRRPTQLSSVLAIAGSFAVLGLLTIAFGLAQVFLTGMVATVLAVTTGWGLSSNDARHRLGGVVGLLLTPLILFASFALALRGPHGIDGVVLIVGIVLGLVAIVTDLAIGLDASLRKRVWGTSIVITPVLLLTALGLTLLTSPRPAVLAAGIGPPDMVTLSTGWGLLPFALLLVELWVLATVLNVFRRKVPPAAVPSTLQPAFTIMSSRDRPFGSTPEVILLLLGLVVALVGNLITPSSIDPGLARVLGTVSAVGRIFVLHAVVGGSIVMLLVIGFAYRCWHWLIADSTRWVVILGALGYAVLLGAIDVGTPLTVQIVLPRLAAIATRNPAMRLVHELVSVVGTAPLIIGASQFGLILIWASLKGVHVLEAFRLVPATNPGVAIGCALLAVAASGAGVLGVPIPVVLVATAGALFVWDIGFYGAELGVQLGRAANTTRSELVHGVGAVSALGIGSGAAYGGYLVSQLYSLEGSQPQVVLAFGLSAGAMVLILISLRS